MVRLSLIMLALVIGSACVCPGAPEEEDGNQVMAEETSVPQGAFEIVPAIDERGAVNSTEVIDLRGIAPEDATDPGSGVTTRLYGPMGPRNVLRVHTNFETDGLLVMEVRAASRGGAYLAVRSGDRWYLQQWSGGEGTIEVGELYAVPLPAGDHQAVIKAPVGTVVVDRYLIVPDGESTDTDAHQIPAVPEDLGTADGYHGIWYYNQKSDDEYVYKYSGGLGTYCAKHLPFAVYSPEAKKTFFVYGGTSEGERNLLAMASWYDHETGLVPRPTIVCNKHTSDAHDNPVIALAEDGHVWVFVSSHGLSRPSFVYRAREPHSVAEFDLIDVDNFSYPQLHRLPGDGYILFHTLYTGGRRLQFKTSPDLYSWSEPTEIAAIEMGHYQVSNHNGEVAGSAFNFHPEPKGLNWRTNLYYVETPDMGESWQTADGEALELPLRDAQNPALVHDWSSEGLNVYMKDLVYDDEGRPVVLVVTSKGYESGPENGPRTWTAVHHTREGWRLKEITTSDSNYDTGSLHIDGDTWTLIAPTGQGPQAYNPGGEVVLWRSEDAGESWTMVRELTADSEYNHTYVRRVVNADPEFAALWADGHARQPSESRIYFCDLSGEDVRRLPEEMSGETGRPEPLE